MKQKIGLLAGKGDLPRRIIDQCVKDERPFHIIAFKGQTEPDWIKEYPHSWVRLGAAGTTLQILKNENVKDLLMAGQIKRPSIAALRPDAWALKFLAKTGAGAFGDDGLLSLLIQELEKEGFRVIGAHDILHDLLAPKGVLGTITPNQMALDDINKGIHIAHMLGTIDVGQACIVQDGLTIAVEAIEGTDEMIKRCQHLLREGQGGVLIKAKKPQQEERADLPTIGIQTIINASQAGLIGVAIEAGASIILDQKKVIAEADRLGLFVYGYQHG